LANATGAGAGVGAGAGAGDDESSSQATSITDRLNAVKTPKRPDKRFDFIR
jgi:hypothetical protein